jgi:putative transposase
MEGAKEEVLAFTAFPSEHWRHGSTNPLERLNKELKRRCRVVGIFLNEGSVIRLGGAVLLDVHDEWVSAERRYFSESSMAKLCPTGDNDDAPVKELTPSD